MKLIPHAADLFLGTLPPENKMVVTPSELVTDLIAALLTAEMAYASLGPMDAELRLEDHADGGGEYARAHVRDAGHLEHPLDGPVFSVGAV